MDLYHDCKKNFKLRKFFFMKIIFEIIIMVSDELEEIISTLKNFYDEKLVLYEKIAGLVNFQGTIFVTTRS
jgi:hypothetical protein